MGIRLDVMSFQDHAQIVEECIELAEDAMSEGRHDIAAFLLQQALCHAVAIAVFQGTTIN